VKRLRARDRRSSARCVCVRACVWACVCVCVCVHAHHTHTQIKAHTHNATHIVTFLPKYTHRLICFCVCVCVCTDSGVRDTAGGAEHAAGGEQCDCKHQNAGTKGVRTKPSTLNGLETPRSGYKRSSQSLSRLSRDD
jgi:hypothetical protein